MDKLISRNRAESAGYYLTEALDLIKDRLQGFGKIYTNLSELKDRLDEGRFHLAVLGQFKRGKSTFLNALLGENLLPGSALPATAIPTFIYPGKIHKIHIKFNNDTSFEFTSENVSEINRHLDRHISEEQNRENILGVKSVELFTPSPILQHGLVLIDTPGIGSTHRHNTEVTMNFLEECDAAVFIFSPDPPITEAELEFLQRVKPHVKKMIFVLNKSDYLPVDEIAEIRNFVKSVLIKNDFIKQDENIFTVSAKNGLAAAAADDKNLWIASGMNEFQTYTENFLSTEKDAVFFKAISAKALDMISEISMRLNIEVRSLELPLEDLQNRMTSFRKTINKALEQKLETEDILKGDRKRLLKTLDEQSDLLRKKALTLLNEIIEKNLLSSEKLSENRVSAEFAESIPPFFEHELKEISRQFNQLVSDRMAVHESRAALLIEEIKKAASEIFEIPYTGNAGTAAFIEARKPYWVKQSWKSSFVPIPDNLIDSIVPSAMRTKRIKERLKRQADDLSLSNVENLSWVTLQNLDDTFRKFTKEFDTKLQRIIDATEGAITETMKRSREHQSDTSEQVMWLKQKTEKISLISEGLKRLAL
jgi:GTPase Era involved in 16S rRNA processing